MAKKQNILFASKASRLRWIVLAAIVASAFSIDFLLKREVSSKVSDAWIAACDDTKSTVACLGRVETHHPKCFELAYSSMIMTFGRTRWESFKLLDYEACMNRDKAGKPSDIEI
jgi:hypothetical protein